MGEKRQKKLSFVGRVRYLSIFKFEVFLISHIYDLLGKEIIFSNMCPNENK
jgi:hypothetical protein